MDGCWQQVRNRCKREKVTMMEQATIYTSVVTFRVLIYKNSTLLCFHLYLRGCVRKFDFTIKLSGMSTTESTGIILVLFIALMLQRAQHPLSFDSDLSVNRNPTSCFSLLRGPQRRLISGYSDSHVIMDDF